MKTIIRLLFVVLAASFLFCSCSKHSPAPTPATPTCSSPAGCNLSADSTVLLTAIIDNNTSSGTYGQPIITFSYTGNQLTKSILYESTDTYRTDVFNYNSQGVLTGTTITYTQGGKIVPITLADSTDVSSTITYTGRDISEIKFYADPATIYEDATYTWSNHSLVSLTDAPAPIANYDGFTYTYAYNSSGDITGYSSVDDSHNITSALPLWIYFAIDFDGTIWELSNPGAHNPTSYNGTTYSYQYNSYNYPSQVTGTYSDGETFSLKYQYVKK